MSAGEQGSGERVGERPGGDVAVVIPAKDESRRIAATVRAAADLPGVGLVVVVDDGSEDGTDDLARGAGATVVRHERNHGKAAAMATGADAVRAQDPPGSPRLLLFVDGDLEGSAANLAPLVEPVREGRADMAVAILPPQAAPGGGRGRVVRLAKVGIARLTGFTPTQPLSGMRCLTREAFDAATPLARGWGVEVGLTVDVLRAGLRVTEVPCDLHHRVTGRDWRARLHRGRQYRDVWLALTRRRFTR